MCACQFITGGRLANELDVRAAWVPKPPTLELFLLFLMRTNSLPWLDMFLSLRPSMLKARRGLVSDWPLALPLSTIVMADWRRVLPRPCDSRDYLRICCV